LNTSEDAPWNRIATAALFARTVSAGRWNLPDHLAAIDRELTEALRVGNGRLILTVPPRHGKSELVSKYFPAWFLGVYRNRRIILAGYEASFAASWGRKARTLLESHGDMFGVQVDQKSSASDAWNIKGAEGGMQTAGVGGPITGKGADVLIIDDPIKNYEEAHSETFREKTWDWFTSTAYTRLEPNGTVILVQTRWHEDDLAGRIIRDMKHEKWRVINFPALADVNPVRPCGRLDSLPNASRTSRTPSGPTSGRPSTNSVRPHAKEICLRGNGLPDTLTSFPRSVKEFATGTRLASPPVRWLRLRPAPDQLRRLRPVTSCLPAKDSRRSSGPG
jgi:hypothetical protein